MITKKRAGAFPGASLQQFLTVNRIDTVIITGITAADCVREAVGDRVGGGVEPL